MGNEPNRINVTSPLIPPLEEFIPYLRDIWDRRWLTNNGPYAVELERALSEYLGVKHLSLFSNGTIALIAALKALNIKGSVITTPFSFVATAHALVWNNLDPIFVDIDPDTLNLDPAKVASAVRPDTSAILPVHCYGNPCDVDAIAEVAGARGMKVLYDAAHAFAVKCHCGPLLSHGDMSILSFHPTKVFNTLEGGAIVCPDAETKKHVDHLRNFGFVDEITVVEVGINGKMNEVQAAFGLLQLKHVDEAIARRSVIDLTYRQALANVPGIRCIQRTPVQDNHAYFPILVESAYGESRDALYERLKQNNIFSRRYFFPLISNMPMYRHLPSASVANLPVANDLAQKVLCLPIYPSLSNSDIGRVIDVITRRR